MLAKLFILLSLLTLNTNYKKLPDDEPLEIQGYVEMVEIGEKIPIHLTLVSGHPVAFVSINVYVDGVLALSDREVSSTLNRRPYYIDGFIKENSKKTIKIVLNYLDEGLDDTYCIFDYYSPSYNTYIFNDSNYFAPNDLPTRISFYMKGSDYQCFKSYEEIYISGKNEIDTTKSRFFDFSSYEIISFSSKINIDMCEFRIYKKLENSDLLFKENKYTSIDVKTTQVFINKYKLVNEERFYINNDNGGIYENYTEQCSDEPLYFFFPLSLDKNESIKFEIVFYDIGKNHCNYIFQGYININKLNTNNGLGAGINYKYELVKNNIEEVNYE